MLLRSSYFVVAASPAGVEPSVTRLGTGGHRSAPPTPEVDAVMAATRALLTISAMCSIDGRSDGSVNLKHRRWRNPCNSMSPRSTSLYRGG